MIRSVIFLLFCALLFVSWSAAQTTPLSDKDLERISPKPETGFSYAYYLYVPPEIKSEKGVHTILVYPNNTGKISDDLGVHESVVKANMAQFGSIASYLKVAVLMPVFPRPESFWRIYTHALDRDSMLTPKKEFQRYDLQLIAMIDDARERLRKDGLTIEKRVFMSGFSAQGMFTNRFTFLHPDRVKAAAIGSPGGWPIAPVEKYKDKTLRYPVGVADIKKVSGKRLDLAELKKVPLFLFMGSKDTNDSVPFDDSYDQEDRDLINPLFGQTPVSRWAISESLYKQAGLNATFKMYPDVAHAISSDMRNDIRAFFLTYK